MHDVKDGIAHAQFEFTIYLKSKHRVKVVRGSSDLEDFEKVKKYVIKTRKLLLDQIKECRTVLNA
jgi:hypothetical protein